MTPSENWTSPTDVALTDLVDLETLQALQDGFAGLTGLATGIRDAQGNAVTKPVGDPPFCLMMASNASGQAACEHSHRDAVRLVGLIEDFCRTRCHAGLTHFAAPILVDGRLLGAVVVGGKPPRPLHAKPLHELAEAHRLELHSLSVAAGELKPWTGEDAKSALSFARQLATTIAKLCSQSRQLQKRIEELTTLHNLSAMLAGRQKLQDVLDLSCRALLDVMGLKASGIRLLDEETGELRITAGVGLSARYLKKGAVSVKRSAIDTEALQGNTVRVADLRTDPRTVYKADARREGIVSALVTALKCRGKSIGVLRAYMGHRHEFSRYEVSLMEAMAAQIAAAIVNARLQRDAREAGRLDRQIKLAAEVQRRMMPATTPNTPHYSFGCLYQPSSDLGGDFYDVMEFLSGEVGLVIADVAGKGIPASLVMASARAVLRSRARGGDDLEEAMMEVNIRLTHDTMTGEFITLFYGMLSEDGKRLLYCNAGHEPALLLRRGEVRSLDSTGTVLGIDEYAQFGQVEVPLEANDVLVLLTDGLIDAMNYTEESYGRERVYESLLKHSELPAPLLAKQLLWDVRRFAGLSKLPDDITLVVVRVH